jgi:hypothetical protein
MVVCPIELLVDNFNPLGQPGRPDGDRQIRLSRKHSQQMIVDLVGMPAPDLVREFDEGPGADSHYKKI